jgi:hypothetical protein
MRRSTSAHRDSMPPWLLSNVVELMDRYTPFVNWIDGRRAAMCRQVIAWSNVNSGTGNRWWVSFRFRCWPADRLFTACW